MARWGSGRLNTNTHDEDGILWERILITIFDCGVLTSILLFGDLYDREPIMYGGLTSGISDDLT